MTYLDIKKHIHLDDDYTGAEERKIWRAIRDAYNGSDSAKAMFDKLLTTEPDVTINKVNDFSAYIGSNKLQIGMTYLDDLVLIDAHGQAVRPNFQIALLHEFSHALNNIKDPTAAQLTAHDYVGDNVRAENIIRDELGFGPRTSYYCIVDDDFYADYPPEFANGYTNGNEMDLVVVSASKFGHNIDTTGQGSSADLLIGGGAVTANTLLAGDGDDFLYGFKGNDTMNGGTGDDTLFGGLGNDVLIAGGGTNFIDGGDGKDIAEFTGFKFLHTITKNGAQRTIVDQTSGETDIAKNIEIVRFSAGADPLPTSITSSFTTQGSSTLEPNDDGYTMASLTDTFEKGFNFFGTKYTSVYVNNNGNLTFGGGLSGYTPGSIGGDSGLPIIAAYWADVDTRNGGGSVTYGYNAAHDSFVATWSHVDYYNATYTEHVSLTNSYQIEIFDQGGGDAEIIIRYGELSWTTGDASGGTGGQGGTVARAGVNSGNDVFEYEMAGSGDAGAMLSLNAATNCGRSGVFRFSVHNGLIDLIEDYAGSSDYAAMADDWAFV